MSCQFCAEKSPKEWNGKFWFHRNAVSDIRACEDQDAKSVAQAVPEGDLVRLYRMVEIASEIRMQHDISIYTALDWVRDYGLPHQMKDDELTQRILKKNFHRCNKRCTEPKQIF